MNKALITLAAVGTFAVGCDAPDPTTPLAEGLAVTPQANMGPDGSQRLRGMAGRVFAIEGEFLSSIVPDINPGDTFVNCYTFNADGTWDDPLFPAPGASVLGTWTQHSVGAATPFTATVDATAPLILVMEGTVTPARGRGILQLEAYWTAFSGEVALVEGRSLGHEVDECPYVI